MYEVCLIAISWSIAILGHLNYFRYTEIFRHSCFARKFAQKLEHILYLKRHRFIPSYYIYKFEKDSKQSVQNCVQGTPPTRSVPPGGGVPRDRG